MSKIPVSTMATVFSLFLDGCGGGGGGSAATSAPSAPSAPTVPIMQAQSFQTAVAPTYASTSQEIGFFNVVSAFRAGQGLGPLNQNPAYDKAAAAHANYDNLNGFSEGEVAGMPGYTGATPLAQVQYQGGSAQYVTQQNGLNAVEGPNVPVDPSAGAGFANDLIDTIYHRVLFMEQPLTDVGVSIGVWNNTLNTSGNSVSDLGYNTTAQKNAGNYFATYPVSGQTGVRPDFNGETPSPVPAGANPNQYGSPISVASEASTTLTVTSFTVTQSGSSTPMPAVLHTTNTETNGGYIPQNEAFLMTNQAFLPNTIYTVTFVGTVSGTATGSSSGLPQQLTWSFTTGPVFQAGVNYD